MSIVLCLIPAFGTAHEVFATAAANLRWSAGGKSAKATFLGKDINETAVLVVKKSAIMGTEFPIQSDASAIAIVSKDMRISFSVEAAGEAEGTISRLKLEASADTSLLFNGKEQARNRGKWIEIAKSNEPNLTLELSNASFATITFDPKSLESAASEHEAASPGGDPVAPRELLKNVTPAQLRVAATNFSTAVSQKCSHCSGSGQVTVSEQYGTQQEGRLVKKLYHDVQQRCDRCKGTGDIRATSEVLNRFAATFVKALAGTKMDDPKAQDAVSDAYKMITDRMIGDFKTWTTLTENGRSILSARAPAPGTAVITKDLVKQKLPDQDGKRRFLVEIGGADKLVIVFDPVSADDVRSGPALVGGLVEPAPKGTEDEHAVAALQHGFLVAPPVQDGWTWWYGWRDRP